MNRRGIGFLCAVIMIMSSTCIMSAESDFMYKPARITWHVAQIVAGYFCFDKFHTIAMKDLNPFSIIRTCWNDKYRNGSYGVASIALLWNGLAGLNKELRFLDGFKKRFKKVRNK